MAAGIIIVTWDDVGCEQISAYGEGGDGTYGYGSTTAFTTAAGGGNFGGTYAWPAGIQFMRYYGMQLCSPTRATWVTGRFPLRHLVGDIVREGEDSTQSGLPESEVTFWQLLQRAGYQTAQVGKLHLANPSNGMRDFSRRMGLDYYAGNLFNFDQTDTVQVSGTDFSEGYYAWPQTAGGADTIVRSYHTTHTVDAALRWIRTAVEVGRPWCIHVSLYGAHVPFTNNATTTPTRVNSPPTTLYDSLTWTEAANVTHNSTSNTMHAFRAALEAANTETNRLLAEVGKMPGVGAQTTVFLLSDNGTTASVYGNEVNPAGPTAYVSGHAKDTPYEGGIRAPLVIFGAGVTGGTAYTELVSAADLFSTVLDLAGVDEPTDREIDGVSLVPVLEGGTDPVRDFAYSEWFQPNGATDPDDYTMHEWAVIGPRYKVLLNGLSGTTEFYDLLPDGSNYNPHEPDNLTPAGDLSGLSGAERAAYDEMIEYRASLLAVGADVV